MNHLAAFALAGAIGAAGLAPATASADTYSFSLTGAGISGDITLTYGSATDAKYADAYVITGISGTFSDAALGISNASILGLVAANFATPEPTNLLAPEHFSRFSVATGTSPISGGFVTYDNLFWPGGSPQTASDYPAQGGFLDIYGVMFRIGNGRVVDLWSNGSFAGEPFTYGVAVATVDEMLHYVPDGVSPVPEPATPAMLLAGLAILGHALRRRQAA